MRQRTSSSLTIQLTQTAPRESASLRGSGGKRKKTALGLSLSLLVLGGYGCDTQTSARTPTPVAKSASDNTEHNVGNRSGATLTQSDQSVRESDRTLTQKIRQAVMADSSLSTNAHNVKIVSVDGAVTLLGPVNSAEEKKNIEAKAQQVAGPIKIKNQLEIVAN